MQDKSTPQSNEANAAQLEPLDQRPLCTPDIINHIVAAGEPSDSAASQAREYILLRCGFPLFAAIVVSPSMLEDHRMVHYNAALDQILNRQPQKDP